MCLGLPALGGARRCGGLRTDRMSTASSVGCCGLELPRAFSGFLAATLYTDPANGCFFLCPEGKSGRSSLHET